MLGIYCKYSLTRARLQWAVHLDALEGDQVICVLVAGTLLKGMLNFPASK